MLLRSLVGLFLMIAMLTGSICESKALGQRRRKEAVVPQARRDGDLKKIDSKAAEVENKFVKDAFELAKDYEDAGDIERAIEYLEAMLKIKPGIPGAKEKIEKLQNDILSKNDFDFDFEPAGLWSQPVAFVRKGKPFRIQVAGTYKITLSDSLGPEGYPVGDVQRAMLKGFNAGVLAGVIVSDNKPGEPFIIGSEKDFTPKQSGLLSLKINVPPGSRITGKLKVRISGYVLSPDLSNVGKK